MRGARIFMLHTPLGASRTRRCAGTTPVPLSPHFGQTVAHELTHLLGGWRPRKPAHATRDQHADVLPADVALPDQHSVHAPWWPRCFSRSAHGLPSFLI
jgi:hypothetical protein